MALQAVSFVHFYRRGHSPDDDLYMPPAKFPRGDYSRFFVLIEKGVGEESPDTFASVGRLLW